MELVNDGPLMPAWVRGRVNPPRPSLTILVKGTFTIVPGGVAALLEEQPDPRGDLFEDDDFEKPLLYPSDFAYLKPRADVILKGTCHVPGGRPAQVCRATFGVGAWSKSLAVIGPREWKTRLLGGWPSEPEPFKSMPLTYGRAFGGPGYTRNPFGLGVHSMPAPRGGTFRPLPNVEHPDRLITNPDGQHEPAGFGPLPGTWPQRISKIGRLDAKWLKERFPWFPDDMDWSYFNAAPEDQQLRGFLRGDEEVVLQNLRPDSSRITTRLPGLLARAFLNERTSARVALREVPLKLDTLFVDADEGRLTLVWRGVTDVRTEKGEELFHLYVRSEPLSSPPSPLDRVQADFAAALRRQSDGEEEEPPPEDEDEEEEESVEVEPPMEEEPEPGEPPPAKLPEGTKISDEPPPPPSPEDRARTQVETLEAMRARLLEVGAPIPPALEEAIAAASLPEAPDEESTPVEPGEPADLPEPGEIPAEPGPRYDFVLGLVARRESLEGLDLTGLELPGADLRGLNFRGAVLERARFPRAKLDGADFSGAALAGADLRAASASGASFAEADLAGALLRDADLSKARLDDADLSGASLRRARLAEASAERAILAEADLSCADLTGAILTDADLSGARLHGTMLGGARLAAASLERCFGRRVDARKADLTKTKAAGASFPEGDFRGVSAPDSVWEKAQLYGGRFDGARLDRAEFSSAHLEATTFDAAEMTRAVFDEASLRGTRMGRANVLGASFVAADLSDAVLAGANLYDAELREATMAGADTRNANLKRARMP